MTSNLQHARRRESPPAEGDPMDDVEYSTLSGSDSGREQQDADGSSGNPSGYETGYYDDNEEGWEEILAQDVDNPPVRAGGNATTIGFEFELLVAVARAAENFPDPHPGERRWLSNRLVNLYRENPSFKYTARNKIIDRLNASGIVSRKTIEYWDNDRFAEFEFWDSLEYETPNKNDVIILQQPGWVGNYQWNLLKTDDANVDEATKVLMDQFVKYHKDNNIELFMTTQAVIQSVRDNLFFMIEGVPADSLGKRQAVELWYESVSLLVRDEKRKHYSASSSYRDPNSVPLNLANEKYSAWSCTDDCSITDPFPYYDDYTIPAGSVPVDPNSGSTYADPPDLYRWFPAEVVSSVLDYNNPSTREALRIACQALREELRIHKPMEAVRTGVHIHIGQQAGWTLLHLKKFATLWHLIEPDMYKLHRRDRQENFWCSPMATNCHLAEYYFGREGRADYQATTTGPLRKAYQVQMQMHVPLINRWKLLEYFANIWQYSSIRDLDTAMGSGGISQTCLRWRINGGKLSMETGPYVSIQTIEFRLMQGTFDAEHIWKWASVCERLVIFARDSTPEVFRETIQHLLDGSYPDLIGLNRADLDWFRSRSRDDYFAYPEPDGRVDWSDPFMIRGYGDTHDDALNP